MLRLPSPFSSPAISLGSETSRYRLFLTPDKVTISTLSARTGRVRSILGNRVSFGGGRLSCVPVLPLSAYDMFSDPGRISPARLWRWLDVVLAFRTTETSTCRTVSRLHSIPSAVAVYASCRHLYRLRKTRFRWLTRPYRTGLVTCRVISRCFIFKSPPHGLCTARSNLVPSAPQSSFQSLTHPREHQRIPQLPLHPIAPHLIGHPK